MKHVWIISQHEKHDAIIWSWFETEAYTDKKIAHDRFEKLKEANKDDLGLFFAIECVELDKEKN